MIRKRNYSQAFSRFQFQRMSRFAGVVLAASLAATPSLLAQVSAQQPNYPVPGGGVTPAPQPQLQLPPLPAATPITPNGTVVEDVVARVNDQIITRSEYARAEQQLMEQARQENVPEADVQAKLHDLLRDMIDQQLLLSKGKELGVTGDAETMRRLDDIRKQNHLDSMEALQKAAEQQGVSFEDFKQQIRNQVISNDVVQQEVGRHLNLTRAEEEKYYKEHGKDFEVPEQVHLSEILIPTPDNATDAQVAAAQQKADAVEAKLKGGANFADTAKADSGGPTAAAGGDLGDFKRGMLGDVLEKATFSLPAGSYTQPIRTRQGFVILKVDSHQQAGIPPLETVERQVEEAIYFQQLQPALRAYLTKAREDAYIDIKPGFVDSGAAKQQTKPEFTAYAPPPPKKKTVKKQRVEQEKAARAQADLAAAREKEAQKQAAKAAVASGGKAPKKQKIHREKIRYGQAPEKALPGGTTQTAEAGNDAQPLGQTAGAAMAPSESVTTLTTGTGADENSTDALAPKPVAERKTRFTDREKETEAARAEQKVSKAEVKASKRPVAATSQQTADEKTRAAPLGLNGNTGKKKKAKVKRVKGEPKERMQEKPKPVDTTPTVAPTVNPALGGTAPAAQDAPANQAPAAGTQAPAPGTATPQ
ncbi:MAG TPA: peptidylprolyl isomerase [Acidobacteriaceae bacterium]|nr:peptidylprolyl isomerase [Acidobacteriaceae bacterium]